MIAGRLSARVNIEQRAAGVDAIGQPVETWSLVAAVWADIRMLSGKEMLRAGMDTSAVRASVRIRYCAGINAGMRLGTGSTYYNIRAVMPDPKRQYIDLVCESVQ